jgi:Icc-related predicted phosphoesterase
MSMPTEGEARPADHTPESHPPREARVEAPPRAARRKLAAVGDLHCREESRGKLRPLFDGIDREAEILILCGDLTDRGTPDEAEVLAGELSGIRIPMVGVLGNHDYETGHGDQVRKTLGQAGVHLLDGDIFLFDEGLGFAGVKGFAGGFGDHVLQAWGEGPIKEFVLSALDEALKLETALAKLRTELRIAILHYSPMKGTVVGEPPEIYPFLGTSRLQVPINRYHAHAVFHGHAHRGTHSDMTNKDVPVFNVALPLLRRMAPARNYAVVEL